MPLLTPPSSPPVQWHSTKPPVGQLHSTLEQFDSPFALAAAAAGLTLTQVVCTFLIGPSAGRPGFHHAPRGPRNRWGQRPEPRVGPHCVMDKASGGGGLKMRTSFQGRCGEACLSGGTALLADRAINCHPPPAGLGASGARAPSVGRLGGWGERMLASPWEGRMAWGACSRGPGLDK